MRRATSFPFLSFGLIWFVFGLIWFGCIFDLWGESNLNDHFKLTPKRFSLLLLFLSIDIYIFATKLIEIMEM